jgi:mRNA interferase MazF
MPSYQLGQYKLRPALIVLKDINNRKLDDVIIVVCTSKTAHYIEPTQYLIDGDEILKTGVKIPSVIKCEVVFTINESMIIKVLGALSDNAIKKVNFCLMNALDLK